MLRLSLRDLRAHVGRYVLTFLAVTIGVCFVAGVMSLIDTISQAFDDMYQSPDLDAARALIAEHLN